MPKKLDWQELLVDGYEPLRVVQRVFRRLPRDPRCKLCLTPFGGLGGKVVGLAGRRPSRKNPNLCQACFDHLPAGGIEIDVAVVFADVRGSTSIGEGATPSEFARLLNDFYATATSVLIRHDGLIDKLIGDEVMALFLPGIAGPQYRRHAVNAAIELVRAVRDVPIGVAVNAATAFVGNVGSGAVTDFTALGDAVNVGARLQAHAAVGEVVVPAELYALVAGDHLSGRTEQIAIRGRVEPVDVIVIRP